MLRNVIKKLQKKENKLEKEWMKMYESPVYSPGNWEDGFKKPLNKTLMLQDYEIYKSKKLYLKDNLVNFVWLYNDTKKEIIIGFEYTDKMNAERIVDVGYVDLLRDKSIEQIKKDYIPLYQVSKIFIDKKYRKMGLGQLTYLSILEDLKFNIISDGIQFDGPKYIYSKFSHFKDIYCDIVDVKTKEIIKENYKIYYNPKEFWDFDKDIWSYDFNKHNIRIILYTK